MKIYSYVLGTFALALLAGGLPTAVAYAQNTSSGEGQGNAKVQVTNASSRVMNVQVRAEKQDGTPTATAAVRVGEDKQSSLGEKKQQERVNQFEATSSRQRDSEEGADDLRNERASLYFGLEGTTTPVRSLDDLRQSIEQRKHELDDEEASTTPRNRDIVKNANPVRLAVHSLLASKDLLGGIGQQVSEIAQHMNDSVATTTEVEAKIKSRGFLARLLFGGDSAAANVISQEVAQNQQRIGDLTGLLDQADVPTDIQATLTAQVTALQEAQARLQVLAEKEKKMWGLFSWRF